MSSVTAPDHALYARQIALEGLGVDGQRALAATPVAFPGAPPAALDLYRRAGGVVTTDLVTVTVDLRAVHVPAGAPAVGVGGWAAVEATRRVLGLPPAEPDSALLARLGVP